MVDDTRKDLGRRLLHADADMRERRGAVLTTLDTVYANPRTAYAGMAKFATSNGDKALVAKLEKDPAYFGAMRGHLGSGNALSLQGLKDKAIAKEWAPSLPGLVKASLEAENKYLAIDRAYHEKDLEMGKGGLKKPGIDFPGM